MSATWRTWDDAWHAALYGPAGFYRRPEGPSGHFATSAQGIPGVGELLARTVAALARQHEVRRVVDLGAGRGELLSALRQVEPGLDLLGVDVVDRPAGVPSSIDWASTAGGRAVSDGPLRDALVLAHEWLDVVPAPVVQRDARGRLRQVEVDPAGVERLGPQAPADQLAWCRAHWWPAAPGFRAEVGLARDQAWNSLCANTVRCLVVAVDYGHTASTRPAYGTLTGFRDGTEVTPQLDGSTDITAHVAVDSLVADRRARQADVLRELGQLPGRPEHVLASTDPPAYLRGLAERSAARAATARPGLGDFWWVFRQT